MKSFFAEKWNQGVDYNTFLEQMKGWVDTQSTSGPVQNEALAAFTKLNYSRLKKWNRITKINEETTSFFQSQQGEYKWLMIIEAWCGDVAQNIATINQLAELGGIPFKMIYRDEHLDLMDQFLTNGGRAIPKLILFDGDLENVLAEWGPRPANAQQLMIDYKANPEAYSGDVKEDIHRWYAVNKQQDLQREIMTLMKNVKQSADIPVN
ncbi:thioredoxin family protein [bacterium SCSIO 12741]|nr:thioredoxin family protein [bacterium SCSIO 12741]